MNVTCNYTTNGTVAFEYSYQNNPTPSAQSAMASLDLVLRLSKGKALELLKFVLHRISDSLKNQCACLAFFWGGNSTKI